VTFYTGLPNRATFDTIFVHLEPKAKKLSYWRGVHSVKPTVRKYKATPKKMGPARKTSLEEEFLVTLMKL
jgi:hypothetical protein